MDDPAEHFCRRVQFCPTALKIRSLYTPGSANFAKLSLTKSLPLSVIRIPCIGHLQYGYLFGEYLHILLALDRNSERFHYTSLYVSSSTLFSVCVFSFQTSLQLKTDKPAKSDIHMPKNEAKNSLMCEKCGQFSAFELNYRQDKAIYRQSLPKSKAKNAFSCFLPALRHSHFSC